MADMAKIKPVAALHLMMCLPVLHGIFISMTFEPNQPWRLLMAGKMINKRNLIIPDNYLNSRDYFPDLYLPGRLWAALTLFVFLLDESQR